MLVRLIYTSVAAPELSEDDLKAILASSREKNREKAITGVLVSLDGFFTQILEGERTEVKALAARIKADARHKDMQVINVKEIGARAFSDWSMGVIRPDGAHPPWNGLRTQDQILRSLTESADAEDVFVRACVDMLSR